MLGAGEKEVTKNYQVSFVEILLRWDCLAHFCEEVGKSVLKIAEPLSVCFNVPRQTIEENRDAYAVTMKMRFIRMKCIYDYAS